MDNAIIRDGDDQIIKTYCLNIHTDKLLIEDFLGFTFTFIFEKDSKEITADVTVQGDGNKSATIIFNSKLRGYFAGGGTVDKMELVSGETTKLLFSLFAQKVGEKTDALNVSLTFYQRNI